MGRRKKGRDVTGWLVIDKPAGPTSTAVVTIVRRTLDARKAGHAGTLDPAATGVLAIALGEATKTVPLVTDGDKDYRFTVRWGAETATDDAEGEVLRRSDSRPGRDAVDAALGAFRGDILQVPPQVSAVKIDGARAYDLARDGETFEIAARPLHVADLTLEDMPDADHAVFRMTCGRGGYVRSIARDLGRALGCLGHVATLRRLATGPFDVADAVPLAEIEGRPADEVEARLLPIEAALSDVAEARVGEIAATRIRNGNPGEVLTTDAGFGETAWASRDGRAIALGRYRAGHFHPDRVFVT